jgi:hypothetical protein
MREAAPPACSWRSVSSAQLRLSGTDRRDPPRREINRAELRPGSDICPIRAPRQHPYAGQAAAA